MRFNISLRYEFRREMISHCKGERSIDRFGFVC